MAANDALANNSRLAIDGYLSRFEVDLTRRSYEGAIRRFAEFAIQSGVTDLTEVTSPLLDLYLRQMREQALAVRTIRLRQQVVIQFYSYLVERGLIASSPVVPGWKIPVEDRLTSEPTLAPEQVEALLNACRTATEEAGLRLMASAGLKPGHAFGLDVGDVRIEAAGTVSIPESGALGSRVSLDEHTSRSVLTAIGERTSGPVLRNHAGNRMTRSNFQRVLNRLGRDAGVSQRINAKTLWKSCVANQLDGGMSVRLLGQLTKRRAHRLVGLAPRFGPDTDRDRALVRLSSDLGAAELVTQAKRLAEDPAVHPTAVVVLAGAGLEMTLRGLAIDNEVEINGRPSINTYASALRSHRLLSQLEKKQIDVWAELRNLGAHGLLAEADREEVQAMLTGVAAFLTRQEETDDAP